jgi:ribonucleotide reductase beta subunit family protein with ferritin-like domain
MLQEKESKDCTKNLSYYINGIVDLQRKEALSSESGKRYALFPILDEVGYKFYETHENIHWTDKELDYVADVKWYDAASPQTKKVIDTILAFFLAGDGAISDNIIYRFLLECKSYEEKAMFISQLHRELMHAASYGMMTLAFKRTEYEIAKLVETVDKTDCVRRKIEFMEKWMLADRPRYERLVAFACAEGIFFSTLFAVIFWFRSKGQFENFVFANTLISKDESLHRDWAAYLFEQEISELLKTNPELKDEIRTSVLNIIQEALEIEDLFVDYMLDEPMEDLNASDLKKYAKLISDNLLVQLSYEPYYNAKNPFSWLDNISMEQKGNFYEVRIGDYKRKSLTDILNWKERAGLVDKTHNAYDNYDNIDF